MKKTSFKFTVTIGLTVLITVLLYQFFVLKPIEREYRRAIEEMNVVIKLNEFKEEMARGEITHIEVIELALEECMQPPIKKIPDWARKKPEPQTVTAKEKP